MKAILLLMIILILLLAGCSSNYSKEELDKFAQCITEKGAVMYGAFWCPHCANTKKMFGSSFKHVKYVECDPRGENEQSELCIEKGIDNYDTWEFEDGSRIVGLESLQQLAEKTGCTLTPKE